MNREFRVRIKRGNEDEVQVPIWIPLSIIAKGAAISHGTSSYAAEAVVDAVIGHGGVVANRSRGGRYVDAMGEVSVASKVSALALSKAGGSNEAATAVENAVLGWGGYLVAFIYANNVVILMAIAMAFRMDMPAKVGQEMVVEKGTPTEIRLVRTIHYGKRVWKRLARRRPRLRQI